MLSYLQIPIWDTCRSFGSCSDRPTGFLAAVFTPGCFEAGSTSCSLVPCSTRDGDPRTPSLLSTGIRQRARSAPRAYPEFPAVVPTSAWTPDKMSVGSLLPPLGAIHRFMESSSWVWNNLSSFLVLIRFIPNVSMPGSLLLKKMFLIISCEIARSGKYFWLVLLSWCK